MFTSLFFHKKNNSNLHFSPYKDEKEIPLTRFFKTTWLFEPLEYIHTFYTLFDQLDKTKKISTRAAAKKTTNTEMIMFFQNTFNVEFNVELR